MNMHYSSPETYPITRSIAEEALELDLGASETAHERIKDYIIALNGTDAHGEINPIEDPFMNDVNTLANRHHILLATLELIAMGSFTSTANEPQYVNGVEDEGNYILTPQEAAAHVLESLKKHQ